MKPFAVVVVALLSVGASCHEPTRVTASSLPDVAICEHLAKLGCASGLDSSCSIAFARMRQLATVNDACLLAALTKASVTACGVGCP